MPPDTPDSSDTEISLRDRRKDAQAGRVVATTSRETKPYEVIEHELAEAALASKHKRDRENATFWVMLTIGGALLLVLLVIIFSPGIPGLGSAFTAEQRAGAITALISLFTGVVGYFTGSNIK